MNITKIYNSILPTYDKSGYNNKNLSTELLFFSVVIINKIDINDTRNFKDNILKHSKLFNFFDVDFILSKLNEEELKFILKVFAENIDITNKEQVIEYTKDKLKDCGETLITFDKERFLCEYNSIKYEYISPFYANEKEKITLDIALNFQFELKCNFLF